MSRARARLVVLAALLCGAGVVALVLTSDLDDADPVWAIAGPLVGWSFAGSPLFYSVSVLAGGLWGGVFLHLVMSFPSGRLTTRSIGHSSPRAM